MLPLSIITINLNNAAGLRKTVDSVVSQTFQDFEFLIIDGGSSDESLDIINHYSNNITDWVSEPDKGIYNAMNKGINKAKGEYCLFLNSGDWLCNSEILKTVYNSSLTDDIIYGDSYFFYQKDIPCLVEEPEEITFMRFFKHSLCHQAMFIRRNLFDETRFGLYREDYKIVSDWEFNLRAIIMGKCTVKHISVPISYIAENGISFINQNLSLEERKIALQEIIPDKILKDYLHFVHIETELNQIKKIKYFRQFRKILKICGFEK